MRKIVVIILFLFFLHMPVISAEDVQFSVDQSEYYFLTGQQAIVSLTMNNTFDESIDGILTYTITQIFSQGGSQVSSSNSQSQSFTVPKDENTIQISFGRSDQPLTLEADLEFTFTKDDETRMVSLNGIVIHFVSDQNQMDNQQDPMQSSSEKVTNAEPSQSSEQQPQTPQEKLQNNQMGQDSQALKEQIQQQIDENRQLTEDFEESLFENSDFEQIHQDLLDEGYDLVDKQLDPQNNDTGSFNFTYENQADETASFQGKIDEGELTDYQKQTAEDRKEMFETLNQSEEFQSYHQQLSDEGYNRTSVSFNQDGNITTMELSYEDENNRTALITAEFFDAELEKVTLSKQNDFHPLIWILPIGLTALFVAIFLYYRYYRCMGDKKDSLGTKIKKPFDYKIEAKRLLIDAERLYKQGKHKLAYGKAGQSLRLYLSYEHGLKKEITNDDILRFLKNKQYPYTEIKQCFDVCSLVEFAKYKGKNEDFHQIHSIVQSIISNA
jgi:hypothetical protein